MFLTKPFMAAQRAAAQRVAQGRSYSVDLPIIGRVPVPPPEQLAIYAALAGLAMVELIDWPVALAMGVGSTLVTRHLSDLEAREDELAEAIAPTAGDTPKPAARKAAARKPAPKKAAKKAGTQQPRAKKAPASGAHDA